MHRLPQECSCINIDSLICYHVCYCPWLLCKLSYGNSVAFCRDWAKGRIDPVPGSKVGIHQRLEYAELLSRLTRYYSCEMPYLPFSIYKNIGHEPSMLLMVDTDAFFCVVDNNFLKIRVLKKVLHLAKAQARKHNEIGEHAKGFFIKVAKIFFHQGAYLFPELRPY